MPINIKFFKTQLSKYKSRLKVLEVTISSGYDKQKGEWSQIYLDVIGILEEASIEDSRYRPVTLFKSNEYMEKDLKRGV